MPVSAGSAALRVIPELSRSFSRDLLGQMAGPSSRAADQIGQRAGRRFGLRFTEAAGGRRIGQALGRQLATAFAGTAILGGLRATAKAASDRNEVVNKSTAIFGRNAAAVLQWSKGSANAFGLSRTEALGAASSFGDMFTQLKLGQGPATDMSKGMVALSADLASFHNADITQVLEAQQAAFRGEYDSLQRFIPGINAARVEQEALAQTHKDSAKDLTAAEKAQATYAIMLKDTTKAQGDFAKTSGEAANQQRIAKARIADLSATIGQLFLPIVNSSLKLVLEHTKAFGILAAAILATVGTVKLFTLASRISLGVMKAARVAVIAWAVAQRILNLVLAANPIGLVITAIGLLVAGLIYAYRHSDRFRKVVDGAFQLVKRSGLALWRSLVAAFTGIRTAFGKAADFVVSASRRGFLGPIPLIVSRWGGILDFFRRLPGRISRAMASLPKMLLDRFSGAVRKVLSFLGIKSPSKVFQDIGHQIIAGLARGIGDRMQAIPNLLGRLWDMAGGVLFGGPQVGRGGYGANRAIVKRLAEALYGWTGGQWIALANLISGESGFNNLAQNPTSSAYGMFQFLDSTWSSVGAKKTADSYAQAVAGLRYIASRYGTPGAAYGAWLGRSPHWYAEGGIFRRPTIIGVGERGPEAVVPLGRGGGDREFARMIAEELAKVIPTTIAVRDIHAADARYRRMVGIRR